MLVSLSLSGRVARVRLRIAHFDDRSSMKRCGFLFGRYARFYMILVDAGERPLSALDRAALNKWTVNGFVQVSIGTLACGRNREVTALRK